MGANEDNRIIGRQGKFGQFFPSSLCAGLAGGEKEGDIRTDLRTEISQLACAQRDLPETAGPQKSRGGIRTASTQTGGYRDLLFDNHVDAFLQTGVFLQQTESFGDQVILFGNPVAFGQNADFGIGREIQTVEQGDRLYHRVDFMVAVGPLVKDF